MKYTFDGSGCLWDIRRDTPGPTVVVECPDLLTDDGTPTWAIVRRGALKPAAEVSGDRKASAGVAPGSSTFPAPTARATDPDTAHLAARSVAGKAETDRQLVLRLLAEHGPQSDFDLARKAGRLPTSLGVRRKELVTLGLVEFADKEGVSDVGSRVNRWQLTNAGRAAA